MVLKLSYFKESYLMVPETYNLTGPDLVALWSFVIGCSDDFKVVSSFHSDSYRW